MECACQEEKRINRRSISTIPISRYHVANLSLETPTILNRHHIRIISKHTINTFAQDTRYMNIFTRNQDCDADGRISSKPIGML